MERNTLNQAKKIVKEVKRVQPNIKNNFFGVFLFEKSGKKMRKKLQKQTNA